MEVFVRVAELGSFSRAAESLDLANATVTTCVGNLERHLRVQLINRDTRRVRLTEEGQTYLQRAKELLLAVEHTEESLRSSVGELRGYLHVEAPTSIARALVCPVLPAFAQRYPDISTAVTLTAEVRHLIEQSIDVAIRVDSVEDADLVAQPFFESRYVLCCKPEMAKSLPANLKDLNPRQCIGMLPEGRRHVNVWSLEKDGEKVELRPTGSLHFNSSEALMSAAEAGVGVACILDVFVQPRIAEGQLVQVYGDWTLPQRTFYLVTPKSRTGSAKVRAFTEFLLSTLEAHRPTSRAIVGVRSIRKQ